MQNTFSTTTKASQERKFGLLSTACFRSDFQVVSLLKIVALRSFQPLGSPYKILTLRGHYQLENKKIFSSYKCTTESLSTRTRKIPSAVNVYWIWLAVAAVVWPFWQNTLKFLKGWESIFVPAKSHSHRTLSRILAVCSSYTAISRL